MGVCGVGIGRGRGGKRGDNPFSSYLSYHIISYHIYPTATPTPGFLLPPPPLFFEKKPVMRRASWSRGGGCEGEDGVGGGWG